MAYATFAGYEIPEIFDVRVSRQFIGDRDRTAGGKLRQDAIASKRTWSISTQPVPLSSVAGLLAYLRDNLYPEGNFWIKGLEVTSIPARVDPESLEETVVAFRDRQGIWHSDGRQLTIVIQEV